MITMTTAGRPDWQPGHIPRLSYRNAIPSDPSSPSEDMMNDPMAAKATGASIREIRASLARTASATTDCSAQSTMQPVQRKKPSLFGGLFAKEPSMAALGQVAAQMQDRNGKITPKTTPYISSQKMPGHVPKVNTKWDGVPETVKLRERQNRDKSRKSNRNSLMLLSSPTRSTEHSSQAATERRRSQAESWDSRSSGSRPTFHDNPLRPSSLYSTDSDSSSPRVQRRVSSMSQSFRSPSGTSLPEITAFFPNDIPLNSKETPHQSSASWLERRENTTTDVVPAAILHTLDSSTVLLEKSLQAPVPMLDDSAMDTGLKRRGVIMPTNLTVAQDLPNVKRFSAQPIDAFLAGEAKPLEISDENISTESASDLSPGSGNRASKLMPARSIGRVEQDLERRPDSSRARLGLRASMVVRVDAAPWEHDNARVVSTPPQSPKSPTSPRTKFRLFGKDRDRAN